MKTKLQVLAAMAGLAVALTGCLVTSVCPFYHAKEVVFEPALLGDWRSDDATWKFAKQGDKAYQVTFREDGKESVMTGHAFKLKETLFLDLLGTPGGEQLVPAIPAHLLLRVDATQPVLKLAPLNQEWLEGVLKADPKALRHHIIASEGKEDASRVVLTASTEELQAFVLKHLATAEAWKGTLDLQRPPER